METFSVNAVVDTHAVIWSIQEDQRLGRQARAMISNAGIQTLAISDITLLEIALLIDRKRIGIALSSKEFLRKIEQAYKVLPINGDIAESAVKLPLTQSDPFDRTITATARHHQLPLITKDRLIIESGCVRTIW